MNRTGRRSGTRTPLRLAPLLFAWIPILSCSGCASPATHRYTQLVMGVATTVSIVADDEAEARSAARDAFARLEELEQAMSDYRPSSELMRLCAEPLVAVPIGEDLFAVLAEAQRVAEASDGRFDCTVGPLSLLWREARNAGGLPPAEAIAAARERTGFRLLELDGEARTARLLAVGMRLDLGGIGKGYAAAKAVERLRSRGFPRCLVAIAGDIAAGDPPPGAAGWRISIECPDGRATVVPLANRSVSTSGDREQFIEFEGVRYSHIVDPNTGLGATLARQVTVIGPNGALVDALASVFAMSEPEIAERLLDRLALDGADRTGRHGYTIIACPPPTADPSARSLP